MTKILITGGAGFIGCHLAQSLALEDNQVDIVDNFSRGVRDRDLETLGRAKNVRLIERDLTSREVTLGLDRDYGVIFHFAAIIGVTHVLERPYDVLSKNAILLANAIELARSQTSLERLVFASTSEVYAGTLKAFGMRVPTPEDTPLAVGTLSEARTSYMLSKIHGEALCHHSGVPFTIVRPHNVYGPRMGMAHVVPQLLQRAHDTEREGSLEVFSVEHRRTFCYISDAIDLLRRLAASPKAIGATVNLGSSDREVTMGEVAQTVLEVVGKPLRIVPKPAAPGSPERRAPDMTLARELTGNESRVLLREGIARTYDWYRSNVFDGSGVTAR